MRVRTKYLLVLFILLFLLISPYILYKTLNNKDDRINQLTDSEMHEIVLKREKNYEEYLLEVPKDIVALQELIRIKSMLEKYEEALQLGLKLIDLDPENQMSYYQMANIHMKLKEWDSMIKYREKSFEIEKTPDTLYYLSTSYIVKDATYALELLNEMELDDEFLSRYKQSLQEYVEENNVQTIRNLIEFMPDTVLMDEIIKRRIDETTLANELEELEKLRSVINAY